MTTMKASIVGTSVLCALLALSGCSTNRNGGSSTSNPNAPNVSPQGGPTEHGVAAPLILRLNGPIPPPASGDVKLDLEIQANEPIAGPVMLRVAVPPGASLVVGQAGETLQIPQAGVLYRSYIVRSAGMLEQSVIVTADGGNGQSFGFHAERKYPPPMSPYGGQPPGPRPPMARPPSPPR